MDDKWESKKENDSQEGNRRLHTQNSWGRNTRVLKRKSNLSKKVQSEEIRSDKRRKNQTDQNSTRK